MEDIAKGTGINFALVKSEDKKKDVKLAHVVVMTPSKFHNLTKGKAPAINLDNLKVLVMDEADLLAEQFSADLENVGEALADKNVQFLCFSATFTPETVQKLKQVITGKSIQILLKDKSKLNLKKV